MKRLSIIATGLLFAGLAALPMSHRALSQAGWTVLFDGKNLDHWNKTGDANWRIEDGVLVADKGNGLLVSKESYTDFEVKAEFWIDEDGNSGIYIRCTDPAKVNSKSAYEVNIFDKRPDPSYGTGAIVDVAKVEPMPKAGGKWNTYEITAKGPEFSVILNGQKTVDRAKDSKFPSGPIALQGAPGANKEIHGTVKFRKVEIRRL